jgi:transcriptional regulator with XRE-family HTH domain
MKPAPDSEALAQLGRWLRQARIEIRQSMAVFAEHIGVAESTVRAMEHGSAAVRIGTWVRAVQALARESSVAGLIAQDLAQFESTAESTRRLRKRAPRQRVMPASPA